MYPMFLYKHRAEFFLFTYFIYVFSMARHQESPNFVALLLPLLLLLLSLLLVPVCVFDIHHFSLRRQFQLIYDYFKRKKILTHKFAYTYARTRTYDIFIYIHIYLHMILYAPRKSFSSDERIQAPQIHRHTHTYVLFIRCMLILYGKAS